MATRTHSVSVFEDGQIKAVRDVPPPEPGYPAVPPLPVAGGPLIYSMPDYVSRNGMNHPATRSPITTMFFKMTQVWSDYVWALQRLLNPDMSEWLVTQNMKSLFNGTRSFDNGRGLESGGWAIQNLYVAGATFELRSEEIRIFNRRRWMQAKALDWNKRPTIPTSLSQIDMRYHFFPTTATAVGNNPFPQFGGRCLIPWFGAERDANGAPFNWVDIDGYAERPGPMIRLDRVGHPFVPARWDITRGLIDP